MAISTDSLKSALKHFFGYDSFRNGQEDVILSLLNGRDNLVVMPTGGGKSLCYQLPAVLMEGTALVISPLIALMKDQVDSLEKKNIPATNINSTLSYSEMLFRLDQAANKKFKLIYLAPERLENQKFLDFLPLLKVSFVAVDEAHCISEWGHDFRPSYRSIVKALNRLPSIPVMALTATATPEVQEDILNSLKMRLPKRFIRGFDRSNLSYITEETDKKLERTAEIITSTKEGSTIVYCGSRKRVELLADSLKNFRIKAQSYHAGMPDNFRKIVQDDFITGRTKVIIATNAFGMGIDKPDVRNVIHCDLTQTLEAYYQEAGRAGRDGLPSNCFLLHHYADRRLQEFFINTTYPAIKEIESIYNTLYDINNTKIGTKPLHPVFLDEAQIANLANLPVNSVYSIFNLFERNNIIRHGSPSGNAAIKFTTSRERIVEYFNNTTNKRKEVLEALLRSVSSEAFGRTVEFDINHLLRKYQLTINEVREAIQAFEFARLLMFIPPGTPEGILLLAERMPFNRIPIDFDTFGERKERAVKKLEVVQRYANTNDCKRNFILSYFQENDISGTCGKCSGCTDKPKKIQKRTFEQNQLLQYILSAATELDGRFGKTILVEILKGKKSTKILNYSLEKCSSFGSASSYSLFNIKDEVERVLSEGLLSLTSNVYPTIYITDTGKRICENPLKTFRYENKLKINCESDKIYEKLKILREEIAIRECIVARAVISDKSMRLMAQYMPKDKTELSRIPGLGPIFIKKFGGLFIQTIHERVAGEQKEEIIIKKKLPDEALLIINLLDKRKSIESIAKITGIQPASIARILQEAIESGAVINYDKIVSSDVYYEIKEILIRKPKALLRNIRYELTKDVDYSILRIAVAIARQEIKRLNAAIIIR